MLVRRHVVCGRTAASSDELTRLGTDKRLFHAGIQSPGQLTARRLLRWDRECRASGDFLRVEQSGEVLGNRTTQLPFQKKLRSGGGHAEICRAWRTGYNRCLRVSKAFMQSGCEVTRSRGGRPGWTFHRPGCWRRISGHRGSYGEITNREPLTWIGESFSGRLGLRELPAE